MRFSGPVESRFGQKIRKFPCNSRKIPCKFPITGVPAPLYALRRAGILEAMEGCAPGEILEIGCGAGALLAEFAQRFWHHWRLPVPPYS
jgi:tRNA G46 methylase TrmB